MTERGTESNYLLQQQYKDAGNLNARIALHKRFSTNPYPWTRWVFDQLLELPAGARILEIGAGPGTLWRGNLDRIPAGWDVTLTDFSPGMLAEAQNTLGARGHPFSFAIADAQDIPYPDASFDAVIANHMLYHVPDRPRALAEIRRVLKPEGRLYAATNGARHLIEIEQLLRRAGVHAGWWRMPAATSGFTLENGQEQLVREFPRVELRLHKGALEVTEAEPLVAYVLSTSTRAQMTEARIARLRQVAQDEIATQGAVHISKETGLFVAQRT
jgi:ubiquinone/menaquinone biosynthesis C-methylase UbiE